MRSKRFVCAQKNTDHTYKSHIVQILDAPVYGALQHDSADSGVIVRVVVEPHVQRRLCWLEAEYKGPVTQHDHSHNNSARNDHQDHCEQRELTYREKAYVPLCVGRWWKDNYSVLSFRLKHKPCSLKVFYKKVEIASLDETSINRMIKDRDLAMVNPAIDPIFHTWQKHNPVPHFAIKQEPSNQPLFSIIVPLFNTQEKHLSMLLDSIAAQTYQKYEVVFVDASDASKKAGKRVKEVVDVWQSAQCRSGDENKPSCQYIKLEDNLGIAGNTNVGIEHARGDYVCFVDHDDVLHPELLAAYAHEVQENPKTDLIYCDEDNFCGAVPRSCYSPRFKPCFNETLLTTHNYVLHCLCVSRYVLNHTERSADELSGAQDYDLTFKAAEVARRIAHISYILYHWRAHKDSTNARFVTSDARQSEACKLAIENHYERVGSCYNSVTETKVPYVYNTSFSSFLDDKETLDVYMIMSKHTSNKIRKRSLASLKDQLRGYSYVLHTLDEKSEDFFLLEAADAACKGDSNHILIMRDTVMWDSPGALSELAGRLQADDNAAVIAPCLLYPDGLIARCGVYQTSHATLEYLNVDFPPDKGGGYNGYGAFPCEMSAVAPEAFMCTRTALSHLCNLRLEQEVKKSSLAIMFAWALELRKAGQKVINDPLAKAILFDSSVVPLREHLLQDLSAAKALWDQHESLDDPLTSSQEVLYNPATEAREGYIHFNINWDL